LEIVESQAGMDEAGLLLIDGFLMAKVEDGEAALLG
jgi:hypothetical protein